MKEQYEKSIETIRENPHAKDSWFKAEIKGNSLIPQVGLGINLFLLASLLNEDPADWHAFFDSKLSPEQVDYMGNMMNALHHAKNINVSTEKGKVKFPDDAFSEHNISSGHARVITEERLQELWEDNIKDVEGSLRKYIRSLPIPSHESRMAKEVLIAFFQKEKNGRYLEELKRIVHTAKEAIEGEEGKELAKQYRAEFNNYRLQKSEESETKGEDFDPRKSYMEKFKDLALKNIKTNPEIDQTLAEMVIKYMAHI